MYNFIGMEILQGTYNLHKIILHLHLRQLFPPFNQLIQRMTLTNLQQYIHVLMVLEYMFKFHNMIVVQWFMYLYLSDELELLWKIYFLFRTGSV